MNSATIRPHPQGGLTLAVPIPGTLTAREYRGQFRHASRASLLVAQARELGRAEGEALLAQIRTPRSR